MAGLNVYAELSSRIGLLVGRSTVCFLVEELVQAFAIDPDLKKRFDDTVASYREELKSMGATDSRRGRLY